MCVVSFVGDTWNQRLPQQHPWIQPSPYVTDFTISDNPLNKYTQPTRAEYDALKKDVEFMKEMLRKAKIYDVENNEPNCEIEEKIERLRAIAKIVDVDLDEVLAHVTSKDADAQKS